MLTKRRISLLTALLCACAQPRTAPAPDPNRVNVTLDSGEPTIVWTILNRRRQGVPIGNAWPALLATQGYIRLKERELAMGRPFSDSAFREFVMSDTLLARFDELLPAIGAYVSLDVSAAAARAIAYLPAHARIRANLYLELKPRTNSFVFTGSDSVRSIFLYVDPHETRAQVENTVAHELHHIGIAAACPDQPYPSLPPAQAMLLRFLGAFSEGEAMLAAAGSPTTHPHAADADSIRARWDRDVANAPAHIAELSAFFADVLDGRITDADSVQRRAFSFYGEQGPWYTVGWLMASTIERELGRKTLIGALCDPRRLLQLYNQAARRAGTPVWNAELVDRLLKL